MFSKTASKLHGESNALYRLRDELKARGFTIRDFVSGNINEHGFVFPQDILEEILIRASRRCRIYRPDSFGQRAARQAVSEYYGECGCGMDPDRILITPGTSLSYWYCFKLLADEGDEILCPYPSYPLFDYIALLSGVKLVPYRLEETRHWTMDIDRLEACVSTKTRAVVLISPHNPTGHVASQREIDGLAGVARRHNLAVISDEVFSEFLLEGEALPRPAGGTAPLVFTLNGFSKMLALPGIKFGWMAVSGDPDKAGQALRSLEMMSDTFLPVNEIVQAAAPEILEHGRALRTEFPRRVRACWDCAEAILSPSARCSYVKPQGGFYVPLRLTGLEEQRAAEELLRQHHLLVHPGYFYDMEGNHLVLSFVQEPEILREMLPALIETLEGLAAGPSAGSGPQRPDRRD